MDSMQQRPPLLTVKKSTVVSKMLTDNQIELMKKAYSGLEFFADTCDIGSSFHSRHGKYLATFDGKLVALDENLFRKCLAEHHEKEIAMVADACIEFWHLSQSCDESLDEGARLQALSKDDSASMADSRRMSHFAKVVEGRPEVVKAMATGATSISIIGAGSSRWSV